LGWFERKILIAACSQTFEKRLDRKLFQKKFDQKRKPFEKRFDRKASGNGVINRRRGCGPTVASQRLRHEIRTEVG
jgi:hypothetical protein